MVAGCCCACAVLPPLHERERTPGVLSLLLIVSGVQRTRRLAEIAPARHKTAQCAHTDRSVWGPLGVWGDPPLSVGSPHVHTCATDDRSVSRPSLHASPHACRCRLAFPSAVCSPQGPRFRFLPLFVTYLELNRHSISRKRENADSHIQQSLSSRVTTVY